MPHSLYTPDKEREMKYVIISLAVLSLIVCLLPFLPELLYRVQKPAYSTEYATYSAKVTNTHSVYNGPNTLIIPQIGVSVPIIEGRDEGSLWKGAWHIPRTGTPFSGNMVIGGHRFAYFPPNNTTFYNLDKLTIGEKVYIIWQKHLYIYIISSISVVSANDTDILLQTISPTLTLFTCTPLWTATERLVIIASLVYNLTI